MTIKLMAFGKGCYRKWPYLIVQIFRSKIRVIPVFLIVLTAFVSCKKNDTGNKGSANPSNGFLDTGTNIIGATMDAAMYTDTMPPPHFTPASGVWLNGAHDTVISGITTSSIALSLCNNITIKNCRIGPNKLSGIILTQCTNITIDSCYIYQVATGVYATDSKTIAVTHCHAKNMLGPFPQGQFVQFKNVSGGGNRVSFNKFENILGESYTEDAISMYKSNGLPTDPIIIANNWIRGGGPSLSGGGIMLGDGGGSNMVAKDNFLVDPGQYGMAVSGGSFMSIVNNTIYAKSQPFTNVGIYYLNYSELPSSNIAIGKNAINYVNSMGILSNTLLGPGENAPEGWNTNIYNAGLNENLLPVEIVPY